MQCWRYKDALSSMRKLPFWLRIKVIVKSQCISIIPSMQGSKCLSQQVLNLHITVLRTTLTRKWIQTAWQIGTRMWLELSSKLIITSYSKLHQNACCMQTRSAFTIVMPYCNIANLNINTIHINTHVKHQALQAKQNGI